MKAVMVMFDSLNRHLLPPYGCDWTHAPNFSRLAARSVTFDKSYVCSMPCMPARRDLHTARPNFLHRGWGPLEPFDDSMPEMLRNAGVYTHLATDHYHYFEDGGSTYHGRYSSWEFFRGQEGDPWKGQVADPPWPDAIGRNALRGEAIRHDWVNRQFMPLERDRPQPQAFDAGLDFIRRNKDSDRWFLQIETFDPHEPFFSDAKYRALYPHDYLGPLFDWPAYEPVRETAEQVEHVRNEYAALLSMCDAHLGRVLDAFDEHDLWKDTMLIVWTDHGFLLGEHGLWAKTRWPFYEEVAHTPFFLHDPRCPRPGARRSSLVQPAIDLGPTLLDFFGVDPTPDMLGRPLMQVIENDTPVRQAAIFGAHGHQINVTDGRYVYMRAAVEGRSIYEYTLMPTDMRQRFPVARLTSAELAPPFSFTKDCPVVKVLKNRGEPLDDRSYLSPLVSANLLFDVEADPSQQQPLDAPEVERRLLAQLAEEVRRCDAPLEIFERYGIAAFATPSK